MLFQEFICSMLKDVQLKCMDEEMLSVLAKGYPKTADGELEYDPSLRVRDEIHLTHQEKLIYELIMENAKVSFLYNLPFIYSNIYFKIFVRKQATEVHELLITELMVLQQMKLRGLDCLYNDRSRFEMVEELQNG